MNLPYASWVFIFLFNDYFHRTHGSVPVAVEMVKYNGGEIPQPTLYYYVVPDLTPLVDHGHTHPNIPLTTKKPERRILPTFTSGQKIRVKRNVGYDSSEFGRFLNFMLTGTSLQHGAELSGSQVPPLLKNIFFHNVINPFTGI